MTDDLQTVNSNSFSIKGETDYITVTLQDVFGFPEETCHWGGYDSSAFVEIKSRGFYCKAHFYTSTGELFNFYQELKRCNQILTGIVKYVSYEAHLELTVEYDANGHVSVKGVFSEHTQFANELQFDFTSDQTYIKSTINELQAIVDKYGNLKGIIK